jgi:hypothetical protein
MWSVVAIEIIMLLFCLFFCSRSDDCLWFVNCWFSMRQQKWLLVGMGDPPGIIYHDGYGSGEIPTPAIRYGDTHGVILLSWRWVWGVHTRWEFTHCHLGACTRPVIARVQTQPYPTPWACLYPFAHFPSLPFRILRRPYSWMGAIALACSPIA